MNFEHPGFFTNERDIRQWLRRYGITDYTILDDNSVHVNQQITINEKITHLPVLFREIAGDVYITNAGIKTLVGLPKNHSHSITVTDNDIVNLQGSPRTVHGHFICSENKELVSFKGGPKHVGKSFGCRFLPKLKSGDYAPLYIGGNLVCNDPTSNITQLTIEDFPFTELKGSIY